MNPRSWPGVSSHVCKPQGREAAPVFPGHRHDRTRMVDYCDRQAFPGKRWYGRPPCCLLQNLRQKRCRFRFWKNNCVDPVVAIVCEPESILLRRPAILSALRKLQNRVEDLRERNRELKSRGAIRIAKLFNLNATVAKLATKSTK